MLFLGDDSIFFLRNIVNIKNLRYQISDEFNMQSKAKISEKVGTFC